MPEHTQVETVSWNTNGDTLCAIRGKVFIEEQGVPEAIERDGKDVHAMHFLLTLGTEPVGCGRLLKDGKVGRMAVLPEHRGQGLGAELLHAITGYARDHGYKRLYLHSQAHATDFYAAAGFAPIGEAFEEAGIPHRAMELLIDYSAVQGFVRCVDYPEPFATLAVNLAGTARRHLRIYSQRLDHEVFDRQELSAAMAALVRRGRQSDIRILVNDARSMVSRGHRLLELSRRLSSSISIRILDDHPRIPEATYLLRDNNGVLYKPQEMGENGFFEPDSRASAKRFLEEFDTLWHWGRTDPRLRQLTL